MMNKCSSLLALVALWPLAQAAASGVADGSVGRLPVNHRYLDWIDCHTFFTHFDTLAEFAGMRPFTSRKDYSPLVCEKVFKHYKMGPASIDAVVNLSNHAEKARRLSRHMSKKDSFEDVATQLRGTHARQQATQAIYEEQTPRDFERRLDAVFGTDYFAFDGDNSGAMQITDCSPPDADQCPHEPCVADYLFSDTDSFYEFKPAYGGGTGYNLGVGFLRDPILSAFGPFIGSALVAVAESQGVTLDVDDVFWTGNEADRTDTSNVGFLLIVAWTQAAAETRFEITCDVSPDDIEVPLVCVDLPNPLKVICETAEGILKATGLVLDILTEQADFQDALVDGAEAEAAYEHSRNLLHKSCAIFDAAVCRCQDEANPAGVYGQGCDGLDSNCNDEVDECEEDTVEPTIDTDSAIAACSPSTGRWFDTVAEAEECIEQTLIVTDDCQTTTFGISTVESCAESIVTITAKDACNNTAPDATVNVQIDGESPNVVGCTFNSETTLSLTTTGPSVLENVGFDYEASDACGGPLNVTVSIYSSEIEDFNAQELALFYHDTTVPNKAKLYLAKGICSTDNNGQCIKDPKVPEARVYTAVISATDEAGFNTEAECRVEILPQGGGNSGPVVTTSSTQRFLLTTFSSIFPSP